MTKPSSGKTVIIERHEWRGFKRRGGPLGVAQVLGWWTVLYCPFLLSEWIETRLNALKNALDSE